MTRVITSVLLQETQVLDSKGEATIASTYTSWSVESMTISLVDSFSNKETSHSSSLRYTNVLLRRVSQGGVCYSQNRKAFVSRKAMQFKAEEYSDVQGFNTTFLL